MSCSTATSPIDITDKSEGTCELKCKYMFKYNDSTTRITNKGDYLSLSYDKPVTDPVVYNSIPYYVEEVRIYSPSLHSYNGSKADAELIIIHTNDYNTKLLVCIPVNSSTNSSGQLETILTTASKFANTTNKSTYMTTVINLNTMMPQNKMYIYSGSLPFPPCGGDNDIIVFNKDDGAFITISKNTLDLLKASIKQNSIQIKTNSFYVNNKGPQSLSLDSSNEIYIDCKPVSDDGEPIDSDTDANLKAPSTNMFSNIDYKAIVNSLAFQIIMSILGAIFIYKLFFFIIEKTKSDEFKPNFSLQMPSFKSIRSKIPNINSKSKPSS
jgi:carbonic anhydrase